MARIKQKPSVRGRSDGRAPHNSAAVALASRGTRLTRLDCFLGYLRRHSRRGRRRTRLRRGGHRAAARRRAVRRAGGCLLAGQPMRSRVSGASRGAAPCRGPHLGPHGVLGAGARGRAVGSGPQAARDDSGTAGPARAALRAGPPWHGRLALAGHHPLSAAPPSSARMLPPALFPPDRAAAVPPWHQGAAGDPEVPKEHRPADPEAALRAPGAWRGPRARRQRGCTSSARRQRQRAAAPLQPQRTDCGRRAPPARRPAAAR
jgi:hypothetical protein